MNEHLYDKDFFDAPDAPKPKGELEKKFGIAPFSVLNTRSGRWQDRKAAWLRLGIRSAQSRGTSEQQSRGEAAHTGNAVATKWNRVAGVGKAKNPDGGLTFGTSLNMYSDNPTEDAYNTSHFDPVLCELNYDWFVPPGGLILDPFAGCSVSGMVAAYTGRRFYGIDLSAGQVAENRKVVSSLPRGCPVPKWVVGDSREKLSFAPEADAVHSCPPYHDLEVYSDTEGDLSNMNWEEFLAAYRVIITGCADRLKDDRFAVITIGDVRDSKGRYRDLPGHTIRLFQEAGLDLYNTAILVTAVGSLSIRTERQFHISRKLGLTHQMVYTFVKGDPVRATDAVTGMTKKERQDQLAANAEARLKAISAGLDEEEPEGPDETDLPQE